MILTSWDIQAKGPLTSTPQSWRNTMNFQCFGSLASFHWANFGGSGPHYAGCWLVTTRMTLLLFLLGNFELNLYGWEVVRDRASVWQRLWTNTITRKARQIPGVVGQQVKHHGGHTKCPDSHEKPMAKTKPFESSTVCRRFESITLPKTNIALENRPFQKESSLPTIHFQVRTVSFREDILQLRMTFIFGTVPQWHSNTFNTMLDHPCYPWEEIPASSGMFTLQYPHQNVRISEYHIYLSSHLYWSISSSLTWTSPNIHFQRRLRAGPRQNI